MSLVEIFQNFWQVVGFTFCLTLVFVLFALKFFKRLGLMDRPKDYGLQRSPIPYYGGLMIYLAVLISVVVFLPMEGAVLGLMIGATAIVLLGFLDDKYGLSPWLRLAVQLLAAVLLFFWGIGILSINLPYFGSLDLSAEVYGFKMWSLMFTVVWVWLIVNAMNFVDGVSGLSSGVSFIAAITLFLLSIHTGVHEDPTSQIDVATISLIVAIAAAAFLIFDFPNPRILMGDTGSTFLGFMIAVLAIFSGGKVATAFLVLGLPILDLVWVVVRRTLNNGKFWKGDKKHLHHRLLDVGMSERIVVLLYLFITAIFGFSAVVFVNTQQKFFILIVLVLLMLLLATALVLIPRKNKL